MQTEISLPFWPSCHQALQWSEDNMIAVAGGGMISILVPRLDTPLSRQLKWETVMLKVDGFRQSELPLMTPLTRKNWSVGEELAVRTVSALRWSSPDLGMFSRSVLGVLYSDHSMVLWECVGLLEVNDNWKPSLILNHILKQHYTQRGLVEEDAQVCQRIRCFAWSPQTCASDVMEGHESKVPDRSACQLLAVATEAEEIIIIQVRSPYDILTSSGGLWTADIVHRIPYDATSVQSDLASPFQRLKRNVVSHMSWSAGEYAGSSSIAFIVDGRLYRVGLSTDMTTTSPEVRSGDIETLLPHQSSIKGLLHNSRAPDTIVCFTAAELLVVQPTSMSSQEHDVQRGPFDSRWSEISGVAQSGSQPHTSIHLSTHHACHLFEGAHFALTSQELRPAALPPWQKAISKTVQSFNTLHRLDGKVQVRTHGLATMPQGELAVTCISMLPADSLTHIINSEQLCSVLICDSAARSEESTSVASMGQGSCTSSMLLTIHSKLAAEDQDLVLADEEALEARLRTMMLSDNPASTQSSSVVGSTVTIDLIRKVLYQSADAIGHRSRLLAHRLCTQSTRISIPPDVYTALNTCVLQIASSQAAGGTLSQRLRACHLSFQQALASDNGPADIQQSEPRESCGICHRPMSFEAVKWARCDSGHRFARCALSLVAILQPGISKCCTICGTQYLNELKIDEVCSLLARGPDHSESEAQVASHGSKIGSETADRSSERHLEPPMSLARLLLSACDKCIWCGGKFTSTS